MRIQLTTRLGITVAITLAAIVAILPTLGWAPAWWEKNVLGNKLSLGLDLQGGLELLLQVNTDKGVEMALDLFASDLRGRMKDEGIRYLPDSLEVRAGTLHADMVRPKDREALVAIVRRDYPGVALTEEGETRVRMAYTPAETDRLKKMAVSQSVETIRNRIDAFGVTEPTILQQGADRILVQLPGLSDPQRAIDLIKRAAVLKFMLLDETGTPDSPGPGTVVLFGDERDASGRAVRYLLKNRVLLRGDSVSDANATIGEMGKWVVNVRFNGPGGRIFGQVTGDNVGKQLAIVLDDTVKSAPVIRERIPDGNCVISGSFTSQEAADLAVVLRSGSLPAPVDIIQQWTVSPTVGRDSVRKGLTSMVVGFVLIVAFMVVYYGVSGFFAVAALFLNLLLIPACLALFSATLTLPGMAGIVLALGMAVDANVLIYERIREELRGGKTVRGAVDAGFSRAFLTILDANLTTILVALVLYQFGTGSIRGFAVVLNIGLIASLFTSVFVTRAIFDWYLRVRPVEKLSV